MRLIDADALMEELVRERTVCPDCSEVAVCIGDGCSTQAVIRAIISAPTIDAAPVRRGEWVAVGDDDQDEGMFFCSRCKDERWFGEEVHTSAEAARLCHYCLNCGADMRKEEHHEPED